MWKILALALMVLCVRVAGQSEHGELRLQVLDPSGRGVAAVVQLTSGANQIATTERTNAHGSVQMERLPPGPYQLRVTRAGFAPLEEAIAIRADLPTALTVRLRIAAGQKRVQVTAAAPLLATQQASAPDRIGAAALRTRLAALPGRSVQALVNSQPGWLYEGNAVLHPRGSEYQTQFVVNGIPLGDDRSPGMGPELEAQDLSGLAIYTAGIPAEYGRKLGGVVELTTEQDTRAGFHGRADLSGGSYGTTDGFFTGEFTQGKTTLGGSASLAATDHYLNPVVPQNYTNGGHTGDVSLHGEERLTSRDRLTLSLRHERARFEIPNEQVQEAAGQLQTGGNFETMATASWQHILTPNALTEVRFMARSNHTKFDSNPDSTPVRLTQRNRFAEVYASGSLSWDHGPQQWKFGLDSQNTFLHENLAYEVTDASDVDANTPAQFTFAGQHPDLEQGAYAQDQIALGRWTIAAGLRFDHYALLVDQHAFSPRLAAARYFAAAGLSLHASYDRIFQTPNSANILLSSSTQVEALDSEQFLRLPVEPSMGRFYQAGFEKLLWAKMRLSSNVYRRDWRNYADDDQIESTGVSFPISFAKAVIYGVDTQLLLPRWGRWSENLSYSYMVGNAWWPVTGGLFLGDDASQALVTQSGHFPDSQDQRNTLRGRVRADLTPRIWIAGGVSFDSGLPFEFGGDESEAAATYGPAVLARVNFDRGRIRPVTMLNASLGATLWSREGRQLRLQADGENLSHRLDVIDFGGLFSGNAIGPGRSGNVRLELTF